MWRTAVRMFVYVLYDLQIRGPPNVVVSVELGGGSGGGGGLVVVAECILTDKTAQTIKLDIWISKPSKSNQQRRQRLVCVCVELSAASFRITQFAHNPRTIRGGNAHRQPDRIGGGRSRRHRMCANLICRVSDNTYLIINNPHMHNSVRNVSALCFGREIALAV